MSNFELHLGDCRELLPTFESGSVAVVMTDPPYDAHTHENALGCDGSDLGIDFDAVPNLDHVGESLRIARRWVINFCALEQLGAYKAVAGHCWVRSGVWVRTNGTPQISGDRPAQGAEGVSIAHRAGQKRWNGGGNRAAWVGPRETDGEHPTQKPLWLMERLTLDFTDRGDTILDPYCGSGSTGVAALKHGRRFIGIERDPKYFEIARRRIEATKEQASFEFSRPMKQGALL